MNASINKTIVCSIVFLDIIEYSKQSMSNQVEQKNILNHIINKSARNIPANDQVRLDTGDGAAIAIMNAPEEALLIALDIRKDILNHNKLHQNMPINLRIGLNLGPVRIITDINDRQNIVGDGINVAQRIMSFANPNEILVSRIYYEIASHLMLETKNMFVYCGTHQDKHVREHEVYRVQLPDQEDAAGNKLVEMPATNKKRFSWGKWNLVLVVALLTPVAIAFWQFEPAPKATTITHSTSEATKSLPAAMPPAATQAAANPTASSLPVENQSTTSQPQPAELPEVVMAEAPEPVQKPAAGKNKKKPEKPATINKPAAEEKKAEPALPEKDTKVHIANKRAEATAQNQNNCTQAQIMLNQCK